jgi:hypothetical protein
LASGAVAGRAILFDRETLFHLDLYRGNDAASLARISASSRYALSAGSSHLESAGQVHHVTQRNQFGAVFGWDHRRRISYSERIADHKQGGKTLRE